jgi:hypothetical protein
MSGRRAGSGAWGTQACKSSPITATYLPGDHRQRFDKPEDQANAAPALRPCRQVGLGSASSVNLPRAAASPTDLPNGYVLGVVHEEGRADRNAYLLKKRTDTAPGSMARV